MSPEALSGISSARARRYHDTRAAHFLDPDGRLGQQYSPILALPEGTPTWDAYLLFEPEVEWKEAPPAPTFWMHQLYRGPPALLLDAARLAREVEKLLPAREPARP